MEHPIQIRLTSKTKKRLALAAKNTGIKQADLIRLAMVELFAKHKTDVDLLKAVITWRSEGLVP